VVVVVVGCVVSDVRVGNVDDDVVAVSVVIVGVGGYCAVCNGVVDDVVVGCGVVGGVWVGVWCGW